MNYAQRLVWALLANAHNRAVVAEWWLFELAERYPHEVADLLRPHVPQSPATRGESPTGLPYWDGRPGRNRPDTE